ncbi:hypothetical protein BIW11_03199, partial [Tropilaelaps mercedesae]
TISSLSDWPGRPTRHRRDASGVDAVKFNWHVGITESWRGFAEVGSRTRSENERESSTVFSRSDVTDVSLARSLNAVSSPWRAERRKAFSSFYSDCSIDTFVVDAYARSCRALRKTVARKLSPKRVRQPSSRLDVITHAKALFLTSERRRQRLAHNQNDETIRSRLGRHEVTFLILIKCCCSSCACLGGFACDGIRYDFLSIAQEQTRRRTCSEGLEQFELKPPPLLQDERVMSSSFRIPCAVFCCSCCPSFRYRITASSPGLMEVSGGAARGDAESRLLSVGDASLVWESATFSLWRCSDLRQIQRKSVMDSRTQGGRRELRRDFVIGYTRREMLALTGRPSRARSGLRKLTGRKFTNGVVVLLLVSLRGLYLQRFIYPLSAFNETSVDLAPLLAVVAEEGILGGVIECMDGSRGRYPNRTGGGYEALTFEKWKNRLTHEQPWRRPIEIGMKSGSGWLSDVVRHRWTCVAPENERRNSYRMVGARMEGHGWRYCPRGGRSAKPRPASLVGWTYPYLCTWMNGRKYYIAVGETGSISAGNVTSQSVPLNDTWSPRIPQRCSIELITCPSCHFEVSVSYLNIPTCSNNGKCRRGDSKRKVSVLTDVEDVCTLVYDVGVISRTSGSTNTTVDGRTR